MVNLSDILGEIADLPSQDLRRLKSAIDVLLLGEVEATEWGEVLWGQFICVGTERGITVPAAITVRRLSAYKNYMKTADEAADYMFSVCGVQTKTEQVAVLRLIARALLCRLIGLKNGIGLEITPNVIMQQTANYLAALESQWPGGPVEYKMALRL